MLSKSTIGLYSVILASVFLTACDNSQETASKPPAVRPIKFITVNTASDLEVNKYPAVIGANSFSELSFQVGGMLQELPVREAQRLNKGDLIAKLDQRDLQSALDVAKAQFQSASSEYQRSVRLAKADAIARNVLEQRKAQFDVSKAQLEQSEKALSDSVLYSPFNGVVAEILVEELGTISPGQVAIKLMGEDLFEATINLPANYIARIPKDESDKDNRQAFVFLDAAPSQPIEADFKEATLIADSASQTYAVTFTFPPPANLNVLPGMNATVELQRNNEIKSSRIAVPLSAVTNDGQKNYVWIINKDSMTVSKRAVTIEEEVGSSIIVTEGLNDSDTIAGAGAAYLSEGMQIREWKQ